MPGALADEEFKLGESSAALDEASEFAKNIQRRADAALAFLQANVSRSVRAAPLARSRPLRRRYSLGEWVYYWRRDPSGTNLEKCHWRGLAMVSQPEYREDDESEQPNVVWLVHGSALLRCTRENLRPEYPVERSQCEQLQPDTAVPEATFDHILKAMGKSRGPVRFNDLTGEPPPTADGEQQQRTHSDDELMPPADDDEAARSAERPKRRLRQKTRPNDDHDDEPVNEEVGREANRHNVDSPETSEPRPEPTETLEEREPATVAASSSAVNPETASAKRPREEVQQQVLDDYNTLRRGEGLNPLSKRHMSSSSLRNLAELDCRDAAEIPATMGDTDDEDLLLLYDDGEEIYPADRKRDSVIEARLTKDERRQFDEAKIKALQPWIDNEAWEAADPSEAHAGEVCPMRFLLKWKRTADGYEANARVILQGFHLHEVTSVKR